MITQEETLARYCAQTDSCGSGGIVDVIRRATSDPTLYIFGELLDLPSVQAVCFHFADFVLVGILLHHGINRESRCLNHFSSVLLPYV